MTITNNREVVTTIAEVPPMVWVALGTILGVLTMVVFATVAPDFAEHVLPGLAHREVWIG